MTERGLYGKYRVERVDGKDKGPYFVLGYTSDPHAAVALAAYAASCEADYPQLAADLREALRGQPECECDEPACVWCEIHGDTGNRTAGHDFTPVAGHPDDDECTHRSDDTDATYCGEPRGAH